MKTFNQFLKENSGYVGYSKSVRASQAEEEGLFPASVISKQLKVPIEFIKTNFEPDEWHHTSKHYNETNYYDIEKIKAYLNTVEGQESLKATKEKRKAKPEKTTHSNVIAKWVEWVGTGNFKRRKEHEEKNATVEDLGGQFILIHTPDGKTIKKKKTAKGLEITTQDGAVLFAWYWTKS